jgi:hypothetical protein
MRKVLVLLFSVLLNSAHASTGCTDNNMAWDLYKKKQYSEAIILFKCNGTPKANSILGYMYEHGKGVSVDYKKASEFYHLAAKAGDRIGQFNLGTLYKKGLLGKPDFEKAFKYYSMSSKQGFLPAKRGLGKLYAHGQGTPKDVQKAISLWEEASAGGDNKSTLILAEVYSTNNFGVKNLSSAKGWATRALKNGVPKAKDLLSKVNAELQQIENKKKKESKLVSSKNQVPKNTRCPVGSPVEGFKDFKFGMSEKEVDAILGGKHYQLPLLGEQRFLYTAFNDDCLDKIWIEITDITKEQDNQLNKLLRKKYGLSFAPSEMDFDKYNAITRNRERAWATDTWALGDGRQYGKEDYNLLWGYADGQVLYMLRKDLVSAGFCHIDLCKSVVSGYLFYLNNQRAKEVLNEGLKRTRIRNKKTTINDL